MSENTTVKQILNNVLPRLDGIEAKLLEHDKKFLTRDEALFHFDGIYRKFERLEQEYLFTNEGVRRSEAEIGSNKDRVIRLEARVDKVEGALGNMKN